MPQSITMKKPMENKVKTFIFVHDADILNIIEEKSLFNKLENVNYVFLGYNETDSIKTDKLIVARDLPINIEQYKNLVAWTGWYALSKNNFVKEGDIVNLFEYDILINNNFVQKEESGYFSLDINSEMWWNFFPNMQYMIEEILGVKKSEIKGISNACMTSNVTIKFEDSLIQPIEKCIALGFANNEIIGHTIERVYSYIFRKLPINNGMISHQYNLSHSTNNKQEIITWLSSL